MSALDVALTAVLGFHVFVGAPGGVCGKRLLHGCKNYARCQAFVKGKNSVFVLCWASRSVKEAQESNRCLGDACSEFLDFYRPQPARSRKRIERIGWLWNSFKSLGPIAISRKSTALTCSVSLRSLLAKKGTNLVQPATNWRSWRSSLRRTTSRD